MGTIKQEVGIDHKLQEKLFSLVMDAIAPWALADREHQNREDWCVRNISQNGDQYCVCVMHIREGEQYTALVCNMDELEVIAVSYTDGNLSMLNPYLDGGHKLGLDLDAPGCWNVLAITFVAEPGAQAVRFIRNGKIQEVTLNQFDSFSIVDWKSNKPVQEFLGVKIDGEWRAPVVAAIPYTVDYVTTCWRKAVYKNNGLRSRWNRWITAAFIELCGSDRAVLQREMMNALSAEKNENCYRAFKEERRRFLQREKSPMEELFS